MPEDPVVAEVRQHRERRAARFNYDIHAIARDARERQKRSGHEIVSFVQKPKD